ncbi:MAG: hypothetical protein KTR25_01135 [Myxococcales bacterium]|nr:hypothetical protein [Myxococcales bacterium]
MTRVYDLSGVWGYILGLTIMMVGASVGLFAVGCAGFSGRRGGWSEERVEALEPEVRGAYRLFALRCSRCHTLARPLSSGITDPAHWRNYVDRMRRMPGSGISATEAKQVLVFLEYYAAQERSKRRRNDTSADKNIDEL